jgi:hypothetical protein
MSERPAHLGDIIREQQGRVMVEYWFKHLGFAPITHPLTTELVVACFHLAGSAVMYFKNRFERVRAPVLDPKLSPPIPVPGHPAYPSGHSTQMHLMAWLLADLVPDEEIAVMAIAEDVAVNRERAGLHYPSDTAAGKKLAKRIFGILKTECPMFQRRLESARVSEWPVGLRSPARTAAALKSEASATARLAQLTEKTTVLLGHDALSRQIQARAQSLGPTNSPVRFHFPGGELFIRDRSLYLAKPQDPDGTIFVDGGGADVVDYRLSPDNEKVAYGLGENGGDISHWAVKHLNTGELLSGESVAVQLGTVYWDCDSTGFYYSNATFREEERTGTRGRRLRFRSIVPGEAQDPRTDRMIFANPEWPNYADYGIWEGGGRYLAYRVQGDAEIPLAAYLGQVAAESNAHPVPLYASHEETLGRFVTVYKEEALFRTSNCDGAAANNFAIVAVNLAEPARRPRLVVPEHPTDVLIRAQQVGRFLALQYLTPTLTSEVRFVDLEHTDYGTVYKWGPPNREIPGTLSSFTGDGRSGKAYFTYESIVTPPQTFVIDLGARPEVSALRSGEVSFDSSRIKHALETYSSADGTPIPIQLITRSDIAKPTFVYLYYYGAIGAPALPAWNITFQLMLELGGMVAIANNSRRRGIWCTVAIARQGAPGANPARHRGGWRVAEAPIPRATRRQLGTLLRRDAHPGLHDRLAARFRPVRGGDAGYRRRGVPGERSLRPLGLGRVRLYSQSGRGSPEHDRPCRGVEGLVAIPTGRRSCRAYRASPPGDRQEGRSGGA